MEDINLFIWEKYGEKLSFDVDELRLQLVPDNAAAPVLFGDLLG